MPATTRSQLVYREVLEDAIASKFKGMDALFGGDAVIVKDGLPDDAKGGDTIRIPRWNLMGELEDVAENSPLVPTVLTQSSDTATVLHSGKAFEGSEWSKLVNKSQDPEGEAANQIGQMAKRRIDTELIMKAVAVPTNMLVKDYGNTVTHDRLVDLISKFGDEESGIAGLVMHSKVRADIRKLKDSQNRPVYIDPTDGSLPRVLGKPVVVSDKMPQMFDATALTSVGTSPPAITVTGRALAADPINLRVEITTGGALGTAAFRYALDWDGITGTFSAPAVIPGGGSIALGTTGLTLVGAAGAYNVDNRYTEAARFETIAIRKGALVVWCQSRPRVLTDKLVLLDNNVIAMHMYWAAHAYTRAPGSARFGVAKLFTK